MPTDRTTNSEGALRQTLRTNLRHYRSLRRITQQELANAANLSVAYIGGIEIGIKSPSMQSLCAIATVLDIQVYQLLIPPSGPNARDVEAFCRELLKEFPKLLEQLKPSK